MKIKLTRRYQPCQGDALALPGATACTVCDATKALLPILAHGQDDVPAPGD
ncbi:hypothetical protein ABZY81_29395 [Streptomyces sp. NPDC006514]|uniref:hypothetical protein n=1 Tax=Streptomyces sp. NPDC006514 TaxID=3154308 RepID=UPI0033A1D743